MKRLLFAIAFILGVFSVSAQGFEAGKINFGARLGLNVSKLGGDGWDDYKSRIGFRLGVAADYEFVESMFIESGLYITTKGTKFKEGGVKDKYNITYLQLPILYSYKYDLGNELKISGKIGPYLAIGLAAKNKFSYSGYSDYDGSGYSLMTKAGSDYDYDYDDYDDYDDTDNGKVKGFGEDKTGLKAFDAGLLIGAEISKGKYSLGLQYELGLANISAYSGEKTHTGCFSITLGYNF